MRERLDERGFAFASNVPEVDAHFVVFQSADVVRAQRAVSLLDRVADVLPWLPLLLAAGAVLVAPKGSRRRAVVIAGLGFVVAMMVLALGISVGRAAYLNAVPPDVLSPAAATSLIDAILAPLRTTLRAVFAVGLVVAVAAYVSGPSRAARSVRSWFATGLDVVRRGRRDRPARPVEIWVGNNRRALRVAVVVVASAVPVFWTYPSGAVVLGITLVAAVALIVVEAIGRPSQGSPV